MGWSNEDGKHEGWPACEVPGGELSWGSTGGNVLVGDASDPELVPDGDVIGWRGACECGWRGQLWQRVRQPEEENQRERRIYDPTGGDATPAIEDLIHAEWLVHIAPHEAVAEVRRAATAAATAQEQLTTAVEAARAAGATWADVGDAAGVSRQSAHERWGSRRSA